MGFKRPVRVSGDYILSYILTQGQRRNAGEDVQHGVAVSVDDVVALAPVVVDEEGDGLHGLDLVQVLEQLLRLGPGGLGLHGGGGGLAGEGPAERRNLFR